MGGFGEVVVSSVLSSGSCVELCSSRRTAAQLVEHQR